MPDADSLHRTMGAEMSEYAGCRVSAQGRGIRGVRSMPDADSLRRAEGSGVSEVCRIPILCTGPRDPRCQMPLFCTGPRDHGGVHKPLRVYSRGFLYTKTLGGLIHI